MRRMLPIAALLLAALPLAGCGSATKTVTGASTPPAATSTTQSASTASSTATAPPARSTASSSAPATTSTTRTAPEPSFAKEEGEARSGTLDAAVAAVKSRGYTPQDTSEYHPDQTLRVLVGTRSGSGDGYGQQAFFFLAGRYLGTDTKEPSAKLKVVSQTDTEVAIAYPLYHSSDPLCCPGGGQRVVHFALNNGKLTALEAIPPAHSSSGLSRN